MNADSYFDWCSTIKTMSCVAGVWTSDATMLNAAVLTFNIFCNRPFPTNLLCISDHQMLQNMAGCDGDVVSSAAAATHVAAVVSTLMYPIACHLLKLIFPQWQWIARQFLPGGSTQRNVWRLPVLARPYTRTGCEIAIEELRANSSPLELPELPAKPRCWLVPGRWNPPRYQAGAFECGC